MSAIQGMFKILYPSIEYTEFLAMLSIELESLHHNVVTQWYITVTQEQQNIANRLSGLPLRTSYRKDHRMNVVWIQDGFTSTPLK